MVSFTSLLVAATALLTTGVTAEEGTNGGYFFSFWTDGQSDVRYTNLNGGAFSSVWSNNRGNHVGGKGWNPGTTNRVLQYTGDYQPNGNSYLAFYGWTRSPLIEYYVVESYGTFNPSSAASLKGSVTTDGGTYDILVTTRNQQPSIDGTQTFQQFWSVRRSKRYSGTITFANHVAAWKQYGMNLGSNHYYQILAVEGYQSGGRATMTVGSGSQQQTTAAPQPTTTRAQTTAGNPQQTTSAGNNNGGGGGSCAPMWGQCGGSSWTGATCCQSGTCKFNNQWYSQCY